VNRTIKKEIKYYWPGIGKWKNMGFACEFYEGEKGCRVSLFIIVKTPADPCPDASD
jgi:hypothetical protein